LNISESGRAASGGAERKHFSQKNIRRTKKKRKSCQEKFRRNQQMNSKFSPPQKKISAQPKNVCRAGKLHRPLSPQMVLCLAQLNPQVHFSTKQKVGRRALHRFLFLFFPLCNWVLCQPCTFAKVSHFPGFQETQDECNSTQLEHKNKSKQNEFVSQKG